MAEDFDVNGASYDAVQSLVSDMTATLEASFSSGVFATTISGEAVTLGIDVLGTVSTVELVSFDITYSPSHLVYYYDAEDSVAVASGIDDSHYLVSGTVLMIVGLVGLIGLVALFGIARHGSMSYEKVRIVTDSEQKAAALRISFDARFRCADKI